MMKKKESTREPYTMLGNPFCAVMAIIKCALGDGYQGLLSREKVLSLVYKILEKAEIYPIQMRESLYTAAASLLCTPTNVVEINKETGMLRLTERGQREATLYLNSRGSDIPFFYQQARDEIKAESLT